MRTDGSLVGDRWGPVSSLKAQPRARHRTELWVQRPTRPWGSRRLPRTILAGDPRRTLFRSLLRRAEGVPIEFADGSTGIVDDVSFKPLGYDFWPDALLVATPEGRRRVPAGEIRRIDVREPRLWAGPAPASLPERPPERSLEHRLPVPRRTRTETPAAA